MSFINIYKILSIIKYHIKVPKCIFYKSYFSSCKSRGFIEKEF